MEKFRIGNDLTVFWAILDDDSQPYDLSGRTVKIFLTHPRGRMEITEDVNIQGNVISWLFRGRQQRYLGVYKLTVEIFSSPTTRVLRRDIDQAFSLVSATLYVEESNGRPQINETGKLTLSTVLEVYQIMPIVPQIGPNGNWWVDGVDTGKPSTGMSAYEFAKENGYTGTEAEYAAECAAVPTLNEESRVATAAASEAADNADRAAGEARRSATVANSASATATNAALVANTAAKAANDAAEAANTAAELSKDQIEAVGQYIGNEVTPAAEAAKQAATKAINAAETANAAATRAEEAIAEFGPAIDNKADKIKYEGKSYVETDGIATNDYYYSMPDSADGTEDDIIVTKSHLKKINGQELYGKGDIVIEGGGGSYDDSEIKEILSTIVDEEGYLYSNGEKVDMRFTRSLLPVGTSVPANANLNTIEFLKIGKYYCSQNVDAKTVKNCPVNMAFSMEVFNPLGTNVDDETTAEYTYCLRVLTPYDTGIHYMQCCRTSGTPGTWTYDSWYVTPRSKFALASSKNDGSAAIGATNKGVYIDSNGEIKAMSYTIAKSVPSNAVFTDTNTKVTSVGNHYAPAEDEDQQIDAPDGEVVTGLKRDAAGHVVGVVSVPQSEGGSYDDTAIRNELSKKLECEVVGTTEPTEDFEVNAEIKAQLAELSDQVTVQFVNENKGITGAGTIVNSTGEKCTNIVAIKGAKSLTITSSYPGVNTFFYDQAKNLISSSSGAKSNAQVGVPEEAYYVAVTDLMSNAFSLLAYNLTEVQVWMNDKVNKVNLPLMGKVLSVNGDSICQGRGYRGGYAKIIGERNAMVVENLGDGGAVITFGKTFSDGTARHCIANTITSMREDADYILIEGGANDAGLSVPVGKISDGYNATLDTSTYCGAFEYMLKMLVSRFAGKKYGYIAVHQCVAKYRVTDTDKTASYYWLARAMCEKWGVPFCDLNSTVPPFNYLSNSLISEVNETYTDNGDGWHPNEAGYKKYYCDKIEAFMLSL